MPVTKTERRGNAGQPNVAGIIHRKKGREAAAEDSRVRLSIAARDHVPFRVGSEIDMGGVDVTRRLGLMDIGAHDCRWIDGDPLAEHSFCGKPVKEGSSWCPEHHKRVFPGRTRLDD